MLIHIFPVAKTVGNTLLKISSSSSQNTIFQPPPLHILPKAYPFYPADHINKPIFTQIAILSYGLQVKMYILVIYINYWVSNWKETLVESR